MIHVFEYNKTKQEKSISISPIVEILTENSHFRGAIRYQTQTWLLVSLDTEFDVRCVSPLPHYKWLRIKHHTAWPITPTSQIRFWNVIFSSLKDFYKSERNRLNFSIQKIID